MTLARGRRALLVFALLMASCTGPDDPTLQVQVPSSARFEPVSGVLGARCGSLDCHGQVGRSLRVYSETGLRLDPNAFPSFDAGVTSRAEVLANYQAVIAIEPEILALVVRDHGADPERLTLVRKARGSENHKGGMAISPGSAADLCILSWLSGAVDDTACADGVHVPRLDAGSP